MSVTNTLAYKNKNPLNLRPLPNDTWQGQVGVWTHPNLPWHKFCIFQDNTWGVRAAVKNLMTYVRSYGVKTLEQAIYRWAPPGDPNEQAAGIENHTEAYVKSVANYAGVTRDYDLTWLNDPSLRNDPVKIDELASIVKGMNIVEAGGETIRYDEAKNGIARAFGLYTGQ